MAQGTQLSSPNKVTYEIPNTPDRGSPLRARFHHCVNGVGDFRVHSNPGSLGLAWKEEAAVFRLGVWSVAEDAEPWKAYTAYFLCTCATFIRARYDA
jgi:hypothetical protein